jgi:branched-chain amino acid transport system ATP-binding protein
MERVRTGYGKIPALTDVSLRVPEGTVVTVLGSNGAGKSTLLRTASGAMPCWSGRVLVNGKDIRGKAGWTVAKDGVCYIPEGGGVFQELSVADNLDLAQRAGRVSPSALRELYELFPILGQRRAQRAGSLSGGEKRMLALGRAVLVRPKIVMLDEPSLGLAPIVVDQVFETLRRLHEEGAALLVVEQFAARALEIADFAWVLAKGRVAFRGRPGELADPAVLEAAYLGKARAARELADTTTPGTARRDVAGPMGNTQPVGASSSANTRGESERTS